MLRGKVMATVTENQRGH